MVKSKCRYFIHFQVLLLFFSLQNALSQNFVFQQYSVSEGLAQSQVFDILEDSRGKLWMATRGGGLSSFDGTSFENYSESDGLPSNYLNCLEEYQGHIFIGGPTGLAIYNGRNFHSVDFFTENLVVFDLLNISDSILLLASNQGLYTLKNNAWNLLDSTHVVSELQLVEEKVLYSTKEFLCRYDLLEDQIEFIPTNGLQPSSIRCFQSLGLNRFLIGTYGFGLWLKDSGLTEVLPELSLNIINDLYQEEEKLWICTHDKGVVQFNLLDSSIHYWDEKKGLSNNHTKCIRRDRWKNLWIGTSGGGVNVYKGQNFSAFRKSSGLKSNYIYDIHQDVEGNVLVATSKGVFKKDSGLFYQDSILRLIPYKTKAIYSDVFCNTWIGTDGYGLFQVSKDTLVRFTSQNSALTANWIKDIEEDSNGIFWIATVGGITKLTVNSKGGVQMQPLTRNQLGTGRIQDVFIDSLNRLWYATNTEGVGLIEKGVVKELPAVLDVLKGRTVRSIWMFNNHCLMAGTAGSGVLVWNMHSDSLITFSSANHIRSNNIYQLYATSNQVWIGTEKGLDMLVLDDKMQVIESRFFGKNEGFTGIETCQNAIFNDEKGNFWIGTIDGLMRYEGVSGKKDNPLPIVFFDEIQMNYLDLYDTEFDTLLGSWYNQKQPARFEYFENKLSFRFRSIHLKNPKQVNYRWKLEGLDENWSGSAKQNNVSYSNLLPGKYRFVVQSNFEGQNYSKPIYFDFVILKPFWKTTWFYIVGGGSLFLLIGGFIANQIVRFRRGVKIRERELKMRYQVLELEQKALRLQMNPHFLFNTLNAISVLIQENKNQTAEKALIQFSRLIRQVLEQSRYEIITLEEEIETLENYLNIERFLREYLFDYTIEYPHLDPTECELPPLLIQPFIENAILHGFLPLKNRDDLHIHIEFSWQDFYLKCCITDNGKGRLQGESGPKGKGEHKSLASTITAERLDHFKRGELQGSFQVVDLFNADNENVGTQVILLIPQRT